MTQEERPPTHCPIFPKSSTCEQEVYQSCRQKSDLPPQGLCLSPTCAMKGWSGLDPTMEDRAGKASTARRLSLSMKSTLGVLTSLKVLTKFWALD